MAGFRIEGNTSGNVAEVTTGNAVHTQLPGTRTAGGDPNITGYVVPALESDAGLVTGTPLQRQADISSNYRQRVGIDTLLFNEQMNGTVLNSSNWTSVLVTMTTAISNGFHVMNAGSSVATSAVARLQTYRGFPAYGGYPLQVEFEIAYVAASIAMANNTTEIGIGFAATTVAPTDGAYFRFTAAGVFQAVTNYNNVETPVTITTPPSVNDRHHYLIVISNNATEFWVDDVLQALIPTPVGAGFPVINQNTPILVRTYNSTVSSPASAVQIKVASINVSIGDMCTAKPWAEVQVGMGGMSLQLPAGGAAITSTSRAVAAGTAPTATVPSNTVATNFVGLGGDFESTNTLAVNTYGIISSFQVPTFSATLPSKTLHLTGVTISTSVRTVLANAGVANYVFALAVGHTNVSLATIEGVASKAPRITTLGVRGAIGALAAGSNFNDITVPLQVAVQPGEFVQVIMKNSGTVGTGGAIIHVIGFTGYWE